MSLEIASGPLRKFLFTSQGSSLLCTPREQDKGMQGLVDSAAGMLAGGVRVEREQA
jgi:hypothetical protein